MMTVIDNVRARLQIMTVELTEKIIGAAIEVHRILGPGLLESIYREALHYELQLRGVIVEQERKSTLTTRGSSSKGFESISLLMIRSSLN